MASSARKSFNLSNRLQSYRSGIESFNLSNLENPRKPSVAMSSSVSKVPESKVLDQQQTPRDEATDQSKNEERKAHQLEDEAVEVARGEGGEEEEGECGFCLFMKGGGCKDTFTELMKCVEEGEKTREDFVDKWFQLSTDLKKCMVAHADYYAPILAKEEQVIKVMESEDEERSANSDSVAGSEIAEEKVKS